ncbi:LPS-assembly protein LptD [Alysiella crassa]|uniref:LPS-assembly protein LptD n=1 Tax=Alysiella crassa TaxID=153491 RepID=UPI001FD41BC4|nr:LPS-assembly protein LptD [Alysiella crassa]UOP07462.1 LPS-assembly protein LptD [Alysiella crassa]
MVFRVLTQNSVKIFAILTVNAFQGVILSRPFLIKPLIIALGLVFSGNIWAQSVSKSSWQHSRLQHCAAPNTGAARYATTPAHGSGEPKLPADVTRITADKLAGKSQTHAVASGDVIVERNDETLNAHWIEYDQIAETIKAGDEFALTRGNGQTIRGDTLVYDLKNQQGSAKNTEFEAEHEGRRLQGTAGSLNMHDKTHSSMHDVKFNTCHAGDHSWYIQASELTANRDTNIGMAKNARLVFGGVPILYTPWADFPLSGNRKSGLLVPTVKVGSDGTELELPYYFNLAANRDTTLAPGVITARGATVRGEFRYLEPNYSGSLNAKFMPHDARSRHNNRYEARWSHNHQFNSQLTGGASLHRMSDDDYQRDFYDTTESVNLENKAWLDYTMPLLGSNLHTNLTVLDYQTLPDSSGNKDEPYALLPRLSASWQKQIGRANVNVLGQLTRFDHNSKQNGTRAVIYPSVQWDFGNTWGYVRPRLGVHATQYWLDTFGTAPSRSVERVLPMASVDSGVTFERNANLFGNEYVQTFEPRLFYNYVGSRAQNDLPNFDTSLNTFSYDQLFRDNIYSGHDRINNSNSITIGLQTRFLDKFTGMERLRAAIGQKIYFNTDNVLLDGSIGSSPRNRSDIIAYLGGQVHRNWFADMNWHYNESDKRTQRFDIGARYNPQVGKVIAARFKYGRNEEIYAGHWDKLKHLDLAAQYPLSPNLYAVGRLNYSISPWAALEQIVGLEYRNPCGCWSVSLIGQRRVTGLNEYKNGFFLTLQLKDLASLGSNPYETLRLGVPGYHKTNEVIKK